jgi:hypothetical protein
MFTIQERVERGAMALDSYFGSREEWRDRVDLNNLDMHSPFLCVLGQVFADYVEGLQELETHWRATDEDSYEDIAEQHGFELAWEDGKDLPESEEVLRNAWIRFLTV